MGRPPPLILWQGLRSQAAAAVCVHLPATFIPIPPRLVQLISATIDTFPAAYRPTTLGIACIFPRREMCAYENAQGGFSLVAVPQ